MNHRILTLSFPLFLLVGGCTVGPDYKEPQARAEPGSFYAPQGAATGDAVAPAWWEGFDDPMLETLLARGAAGNYDLRAARARVAEARSLSNAERGAFLPAINADAAALREERSLNGFLSDVPDLDRINSVFTGSLDASWELDFFGRTERAVEAADARVAASRFAFNDLLNVVLAETASQYFTWRSLHAQLVVLEKNIALQRETLDVVEARFEAGTENELALARARQRVLDLEARRPRLIADREGALLAIAVLTAAEPEALAAELRAAPVRAPRYGPDLVTGVPADLLRRRPDIRQAERELAAETATLGVRAADLYPRFSLVGSLGLESLQSGDLTQSASRFWSIGPEVFFPLFQGGTLRSRRQAQQARVEAALARYQATVTEALRDVEDAAVRVYYSRDTARSRERVLEQARRAYGIAREQYQVGVLPLDDLLSVQTDLNAAEDALTVSRYTLAREIVNLGQALGGGWRAEGIREVAWARGPEGNPATAPDPAGGGMPQTP